MAVINRDAEAVRDLTKEMPSPHPIVIRADVASEKDVEKAFQKIATWQDCHATGAFLVVRSAVSLLRLRKGAIVMMASTHALQPEPHTETYAAAKGAICAMPHALAINLGPGQYDPARMDRGKAMGQSRSQGGCGTPRY